MSQPTLAQAQRLQRDGYLVLRNAVSQDLVASARRLLFQHMGNVRAATARVVRADATDRERELEALKEASTQADMAAREPAVTDLFNASPLQAFVSNLLDCAIPAARGAQLATLYPSDDDATVNEAGYRNADTPHFGWCGHLDGLWNGATQTPPVDRELTAQEHAAWHEPIGTNQAAKYYPEHHSNIANFTALVGVALSDQRAEGSGGLGILKGAHKHIGEFFQQQQALGGPLGPEGPGWERVNELAPNHHGLRHYPEQVRDRYRRGARASFDGKLWPKPTILKVKPGDAVIVHWATPHSASRVLTSDPRMMVYFRITSTLRPEANRRVYPAAMTDIWLEWPGLEPLISAGAGQA